MYQIVAALTVFAHFTFIGYLVVGGFLALRWPRSFWLHVPAVVWGVVITAAHLDCPLTWLERWARAKAGMSALGPDGFVATYITGVLYPTGWVGMARSVVFVLVATSWLLYAWQRRGSSARRFR